jgi:hypothetical protein
VHAVRRIHAALLPGGLVVDSQPVSPDSRVEAADGGRGCLDMREWRATIEAVDGRRGRRKRSDPVRVLQEVRLRILRVLP